MAKRPPTADGVSAAAKRVRGHVLRTPLLPFEWEGVTVWAKPECLQLGGSFKLRGATNRLGLLSPEERARGVVAFSSGNHAQGVAIAAARLGIQATIVLPADAPAVKREATLRAGATIVEYDRATEDRVAIAENLARQSGATIVPAYDDPDIIEGQGTVGVEIGEMMLDVAGDLPTKVVVPCGGGGLSSGIALALPEADIVAVEPDGWDDMRRSLALGRRVPVEPDAPPSRCDALQTLLVSELTFDVLRARGTTVVSVNDGEVAAAMAFAARHLRLVVEPGGAVALAALLAGKAGDIRERTVVVLSGGNVDPDVYLEMMRSQAAEGIR